MTQEEAWREANAAGDRIARRFGRSSWSRQDFNAAIAVFATLYPVERAIRQYETNAKRDHGLAGVGCRCRGLGASPARRGRPFVATARERKDARRFAFSPTLQASTRWWAHISAAKSLEELRDRLNELHAACARESFAFVSTNFFKPTTLPTFGGKPMRRDRGAGVYSWDRTRFLGAGSDGYVIYNRA